MAQDDRLKHHIGEDASLISDTGTSEVLSPSEKPHWVEECAVKTLKAMLVAGKAIRRRLAHGVRENA